MNFWELSYEERMKMQSKKMAERQLKPKTPTQLRYIAKREAKERIENLKQQEQAKEYKERIERQQQKERQQDKVRSEAEKAWKEYRTRCPEIPENTHNIPHGNDRGSGLDYNVDASTWK